MELKFSEIQKKILKILFDGPIKQAELTKIFNRKRSTMKYHLDRLKHCSLIRSSQEDALSVEDP